MVSLYHKILNIIQTVGNDRLLYATYMFFKDCCSTFWSAIVTKLTK